MFLREEALQMHSEKTGKLELHSKIAVKTQKDLSLAYTPGVAEPCLEIFKDASKVYEYTMKGNLVAVITNGTAVLGLGDIGAKASIPVMEGKAVLFKEFANVDAFPICLDTKNTQEIVNAVKLLEPIFGGINLEDIAAPQCFEIEEKLRRECSVPIFHDDQHGTAIVTVAGLMNALKLVKKSKGTIRVVVNGAGAAGIAIVKLLLRMGIKYITICDTKGIISRDRSMGMNKYKVDLSKITNRDGKNGTLSDALIDADVFIGVSSAGALTKEMISSMNNDPIIFAMANPNPEILPEDAKATRSCIIGTGRSDYPNQVNNVLAFPGIFRGALNVQATEINEEMKVAAVYAIAGLIEEKDLNDEYIIPNPFDLRVSKAVADAVSIAAIKSGVAQKDYL